MKNKFLCFIIIFLASILQCQADIFEHKIDVQNLGKKLPVLNNIECNFKQEKILKNITKPLISGGNFKFDKTKGIFFETTYPIKTTTSYTSKDYEQINDIILAISNKKYSKLDKTFDFYYQTNIDTWILGLKPKKNTGADKYIESIVIHGTDNINQIVISMQDGSKTTQWFFQE